MKQLPPCAPALLFVCKMAIWLPAEALDNKTHACTWALDNDVEIRKRLCPPMQERLVCRAWGFPRADARSLVQALTAHLESSVPAEDEADETAAAPDARGQRGPAARCHGSRAFTGFSDASLDQFMELLAQLATRGPESARSEAAQGLVQLALLRGR